MLKIEKSKTGEKNTKLRLNRETVRRLGLSVKSRIRAGSYEGGICQPETTEKR